MEGGHSNPEEAVGPGGQALGRRPGAERTGLATSELSESVPYPKGPKYLTIGYLGFPY